MSGKRDRRQLRKHSSAARSSNMQAPEPEEEFTESEFTESESTDESGLTDESEISFSDESTPPSSSRISEIYMTDDESNELSAEEIVVEPDHVHLSFENIQHDKIIYQPSPSSTTITLDRHSDLICLNRTAYLNDNIVSFYLTYLKHKHPNGDKIHLFDTFFFAKMIEFQDKFKGDQHQVNHLYQNAYEEIAHWTSSIDIFEFDFLIVPIFKDKHWMVAFICYPGKLIETTIDLESNERPCIIFFDSLNKLGGSVLKQYAQSLKTFVQEEMFKKNEHAKILTNEDLPVLNPEVPAQTTDYDCGIFLLHYAEKFLENPGVIFNNRRLAKVRLNKWFDRSELAHQRIEIASLIEDIYQKSDKSMYRTSMSEEQGDISVLSENVSSQTSTSRPADLSGATGSSSSSQARLKKIEKKINQQFGKNAEIPIYEYPAGVSSEPSNAFAPDVFSIFDEPFSSDFGDSRPPSKSTTNQEPERPRELKVSRKATVIEDLVDLSESSPPKDEHRFTSLQPPAKKPKTSHYLHDDFEGLVSLDGEDEEE